VGGNISAEGESRQVLGESGIFNRISVLRAERGVTRQQLADALNVNYQTIGFLERGDYSPSLKLAFGLSGFFRLPVEAIFSTKPFKPLSEQVYGTRDLQRTNTEPKRESE
jgi:putative transcriptional regulator